VKKQELEERRKFPVLAFGTIQKKCIFAALKGTAVEMGRTYLA